VLNLNYRNMKRTRQRLYAFFLSTLLLSSVTAGAQTFGTALEFDGTDDYLTLPNNFLASATGSFTLEAWVYWRGGSQWQRIFDAGTGTSNNMFLTPFSNFGGDDGVLFAFITPSSTQVLQSADPLPQNTWVHVAVTVDHATNLGRLFVNGELKSSNTNITIRPADLGAVNQNWLGRSQFGADPYFNGVLDEVRLSTTVRYTADFAPPTMPFTADGATLLLYQFSEGSGQTTADASANAFTATLGASNAPESQDPSWYTTSILPIRISEFTARRSGGSVMLQWKYANTGTAGRFFIERSTDGVRFEVLSEVNVGASPGQFSYAFTDPRPQPGRNFYRVRTEEANGSVRYSLVIPIDMTGIRQFSIYPTIAEGQVYLKLSAPATILFTNSVGQVVKRIQLQNAQPVDISQLPKGSYLLTVEESGETARLIKQ
jgi:hypothetical protein